MSHTFTGTYKRASSGEVFHYTAHYRFTKIGVVYEAQANFGSGPTARVVLGVITWGLRCIPPRWRVERDVRDTIELLDINKFKSALRGAG
jgi:hypothetical protein